MAPIWSIQDYKHPKSRLFEKGYHHWFATRPGYALNLRAIALGFSPKISERLWMAPQSGFSNMWLYQPCFRIARRDAKAKGVVIHKQKCGQTAKMAGIMQCENSKCKRRLKRGKKKDERPAERPRPGISDRWLCINCFVKYLGELYAWVKISHL